MKKIALTAAALVVATGGAFAAGSDRAAKTDTYVAPAAIDQSTTASVNGSVFGSDTAANEQAPNQAGLIPSGQDSYYNQSIRGR